MNVVIEKVRRNDPSKRRQQVLSTTKERCWRPRCFFVLPLQQLNSSSDPEEEIQHSLFLSSFKCNTMPVQFLMVHHSNVRFYTRSKMVSWWESDDGIGESEERKCWFPWKQSLALQQKERERERERKWESNRMQSFSSQPSFLPSNLSPFSMSFPGTMHTARHIHSITTH